MRDTPVAPDTQSLRRAALTSRWIGLASVACGGIILYSPLARVFHFPGEAAFYRIVGIGGFVLPGLLYVALPTFLLRRQRWALFALVALALLTLLLMGLLFVMQLFNLPASAWLCAVCLIWVAAVAVLCGKLARTLTAMGSPANPDRNPQKPRPPRR